MNPKASATLEKAQAERRRSNFKKAMSRLDDGIDKYPNELTLYTEAIDIAMEAGESLKALQYLKTAQQRLPHDGFELWTFASEKVGTYNDPIVAKFLIEDAIKSEDLSAAHAVVENLKEHTAEQLLGRIRTKKQTLSTAFGGGLSVANDLVNNALTEALLCLRLNRFPEAMDGFVEVLDQKRESHTALEPFLVDLEKRHAEKGETSFALGCCYLAANQYAKGSSKIVCGAKTTLSLTDDAIRRIESLEDRFEFPAWRRQLCVAELYIDKREDLRAFETLDPILKKTPASAADVLGLLEPRVQEICEPLGLHFLYVDAALSLGRRDTAISLLRRIYGLKNFRSDVIAWLDERSCERSTPIELLALYGEVALKEGMFGKAIEIFKEILSRGSQEEPTIRELLLRHSSVPLIRHFLDERFGSAKANPKTARFQFETYDRFEPQPSTPRHLVDTERVSSDGPVKRGEQTQFTHGEFAIGGTQDNEIGDTGFDNRDFSLNMNGREKKKSPPVTSVDSESGEQREPRDRSDLFEYLKRDFCQSSNAPADEPAGSYSDADEPISSDHEDVPTPDTPARGCGEEDHTDYPTMSAPEEREGAHADDLSEDTAPSPQYEETDEPADFDSLFDRFETGRLGPDETLELIAEAAQIGRFEEMKKLLGFEPVNFAQEVTRKCYLAKYYLALDRPLPALIVLKSVHLQALSKEERLDVLLRIAECYQRTQNYEAAHSVFLRIIGDHPEIEAVEKMAGLNYEKYLRAVSGGAPALEKLTSL